MDKRDFWCGKKVLITGHTGFKGSWLSLWLLSLGARITGYALQPPTNPSLFEMCNLQDDIYSVIGDIRDVDKLSRTLHDTEPEIVFHMAAQPIVRESYKNPLANYATNVMGTVHIFEAIRACKSVRAVINITTDKCYDNKEWVWGYRELDSLGGYDPYSASKACSELITASYRNSFFNPAEYGRHGVAVASVRAGNVIGGGDWAVDRLIPDCVRALLANEPIVIRNPKSIRPWQHVVEPLGGYLLLAHQLVEYGVEYGEAWNFGPDDSDAKPVEWIVRQLCKKWDRNNQYYIDGQNHPHEAYYLKLDCSKARTRLGWRPKWNLEQALTRIVDWTQAYTAGKDMRQFCLEQIKEYSI